MITYNTTSSTQKLATARLYTIRVHRKKNTNTLYTINALNAAVAKDNGGKTGKQYRLDWAQYENSLLLTKNGVLEVCPVRVVKIFKIEDEPVNTPLADSSE